MTLTINPVATVSANVDDTICEGSTYTLSGSIGGGASSITWTTSGSGTFDDTTLLAATYTPSAADILAGSVILIITTDDPPGPCNVAVDSTVLVISSDQAIANAGPDQDVCVDADSVSLTGSVTIVPGGIWTTSGTGTFSPSADSLITNYIPSSADTTAGSVILILTTTGNGACLPKADSMLLTFLEIPTVSAGSDLLVCSSTDSVQLTGSVSGGIGGFWTTTGGGVFSPNSGVESPVYVHTGPTVDTLVLFSNGGCIMADTVILTVLLGPTTDAGPDIAVCITNPLVSLSGTVTVVSNATWGTSGSGIFIPNNTVMNPTYSPSVADTAAGSIIITLTSDSIGNCAYVDTMIITYTPDNITVDAGPDTTVCKNVTGVAITGTVTVATGGTWTSLGSGSFSPSTDSLSTNYLPSGGDTAAGSVILVLTTTGNGGCIAKTDTMVISFFPALTVFAGNDTILCINADTLFLSGIISGGGTGYWTTDGAGLFTPDDSTLTAGYVLAPQDLFNGTVNIILHSDVVGFCSTSDTMQVTIIPNAYAGPDQFICIGEDTVHLTGSVGGASGGAWTCDPPCTGTFVPSDSLLTTDYIISAADSTAGSVTFILNSTGNLMGCPSASDTMVVFITPPPTVDAGTDTIIVCSNNPVASLNGVVTDAFGGVWTTNGSGTFVPSADSLTTTYILSDADTSAGIVILTLTTTGSCPILSDSVVIDVIEGPAAKINYTEVCYGETIIFTDATPGVISSWFWDFGDSSTDTVQNPNPHLYAIDGFYNVMLAVVSVNGCIDTVINPVLIHPIPVANFSSIANCLVDSVQFTDLSTVSIDNLNSWNWNFGDSSSSTQQNPTHLYGSENDYLVTLTVTSTFGCTASFTATIEVESGPKAAFTYSQACYPDPIVFTDSSYVDNSVNPHTIVSWFWDFGDSTTDSTQNPPPHVFPSPGVYNVELLVTSENGCNDSITISVQVDLKPVADFTFNNACEIDSVYFTDNSTVGAPDIIVAWQWNFGDGGSSTNQNASHIYGTFGSYLVELIVTSNNGCADTSQQVVFVSPNPQAAFNVSDYIVSTEDAITFTDQSTGSSAIPDTIAIDSWDWDFYYPAAGIGDSMSTFQNSSHLYGDTGYYVIQLVITNEYGCTDTILDTVQVGLNPLVASGFTPDGNDKNDILLVEGGPYSELAFIIYNKWGETIFTSNNQDDGWDGTFKGVPQPMGVYVYTVIAKSIDGKDHQLWGDVTLLR